MTRARAVASLVFVVTGCSLNPQPGAPDRAVADREAVALAVIGQDELTEAAARGVTLTTVLSRRVSNFAVAQHSNVGSCPVITLRGTKSMELSSEPVLYIDGMRTLDTCLLESLPLRDLSLVEVYGTGQAPPGSTIGGAAGGLILVHTKR